MLSLPATVTLPEATDTLRALKRACGADTDSLVVDAAALQQFDSSALAVLMECKRAAGTRAFAVRNAPPKLLELAKLYGVDEVLGLSLAA